jgi:hypothetical protein
MTTKQQVLALVAELGGEIEIRKGDGPFEIIIDAPDGKLWASDGLHCLVHSQWDDQPTIELWRDALERVRAGLEPCEDDECDYCHPETEVA